ncbi:Hypothetical protein SCF082_LOCUS8323 [Durusdinium trenchii]|uniref:Cation efflux protein transmembrane domain-containing protein n=1 Tax=Durusdinium trenchii TaxID=1381693 RepID=A0ABP0IT06_9DINO
MLDGAATAARPRLEPLEVDLEQHNRHKARRERLASGGRNGVESEEESDSEQDRTGGMGSALQSPSELQGLVNEGNARNNGEKRRHGNLRRSRWSSEDLLRASSPLGRCWCYSCCVACIRMSADGNSLRALYVLFVLTSLFTVAQFFGAVVANSLSMYGDCVTMAVDSGTYLLNIYAERRKLYSMNHLSEHDLKALDRARERLDTRAAVVSVLALLSVTIYIMIDAGQRIHSEVGVDPVNPKIMFGFTCVGLTVNFISCSAFFYSPGEEEEEPSSSAEALRSNAVGSAMSAANKAYSFVSDQDQSTLRMHLSSESSISRNGSGEFTEVTLGETGENGSAEMQGRLASAPFSMLDKDDDGGPASSRSLSAFEQMQTNLNVLSAFVHLLADTLRSITVFVTSLYVWATHGDSVRADAVSSIIVCTFILFAVAFLIFETWKRVVSLREADVAAAG